MEAVELKADEVETLRRVMAYFNPHDSEPLAKDIKDALAILDRLSPPAPGVEVTQADRDRADETIIALLPVFGDVPSEFRDALIRSFQSHRTEAEARGRREALEEAVMDLRAMSRGHVAHECLIINGAADRIERLMTEGK